MKRTQIEKHDYNFSLLVVEGKQLYRIDHRTGETLVCNNAEWFIVKEPLPDKDLK